MSSPGVNLLPPEYAKRATERRRGVLTILGVIVVVAGLGGLYYLKTQSVEAARERRDAAVAEVSRLTAEVAALSEFASLASDLDAGNTLLAAAMAQEVSFARLLNDVALAFPSTSSLVTLAGGINAGAGVPSAAPPPTPGTFSSGDGIATITFSGYSVERFAPGVETVLIEFARIRNITSDYLETAAGADIGDVPVTNFNGRATLGSGAFTNRYADGLPEDR